MGNHDAGRAMGRMAAMALKMRTSQSALELLDEICRPWQGCDAEFDAVDPNNPRQSHPVYCRYTDPEGPLGTLIREAFDFETDWIALLHEAKERHRTTEDDEIMEEFWESWQGTGPAKQFDERYGFC